MYMLIYINLVLLVTQSLKVMSIPCVNGNKLALYKAMEEDRHNNKCYKKYSNHNPFTIKEYIHIYK